MGLQADSKALLLLLLLLLLFQLHGLAWAAHKKETLCIGDPDKFDAGYGPCSTYAISNKNWCDSDKMKGMYAEEVCPECGVCAPKTPSPARPTPAPTAPEELLCVGDSDKFNAGFGPCSTYATYPNKYYCGLDKDKQMGGMYAKEVCPECGVCTTAPPTPAPPTQASTSTLTSTTETSFTSATSTTTLTSTSETSTTTHVPTPAPTPVPTVPTPAPTPVPTPTPSSACTDDPDWSPASRPWKSCAWTQGKSWRCKQEDKDGTSGYQACPVTCGDDPSWKFLYKRKWWWGYTKKGCGNWWPGAAITCAAEGLDGRTGTQACPESCAAYLVCRRRLAIAV